MIEFQHIYFDYNQSPLLVDFNLELLPGEKMVLYGDSGSGKSTILHSIMGFVHAKSGEIIVDGMPLNSHNVAQIRQQIAWLPQEFALPSQQVEEAIYSPFTFKCNVRNRPEQAVVLSHLAQLGLDGSLLKKQMNELSGGQRQRVMLITAMLLQKPILLLDEPTSALDPQSIEKVITYLKSNKEQTLLAVSHDTHFVDAFDKKIKI